MYASQTKRLCVREAPSGETRVHSNSSAEAVTESSNLQQQQQPTSSLTTPSLVRSINNNNYSVILPGSSASTAIKRSCSTYDPTGGLETAASLEPIGPRLSQTDSALTDMTASATESATTRTGDENKSPKKTPTNSNQSPVIHRNGLVSHESRNDLVSTNQRHSHNYSEQELIDKLLDATSEKSKLELILTIRNLITACNKKKESLIRNADFFKVLQIIDIDNDSSSIVKAQLALLLCSIAKGSESNVEILNKSLVDERIIHLILNSQDDFLIEACLRCLRAMMSWPQASRNTILYGSHSLKQNLDSDKPNDAYHGLRKIIDHAHSTKSFIVQECIADIFALTCSSLKEQLFLHSTGALSCISCLLESNSSRVIVSALNWLISICLKNATVSLEATSAICPSGTSLLDRLIDLMRKDECLDLQLLSAKCFTRIYRAIPSEQMEKESRITLYILPTLVRMTQRDKPSKLRADAAECIAYLIECDQRLQETASICDHLINSLASMLDHDSSNIHDFKDHHYQNQYPHHLQLTSSSNRNLNERDLALSAISMNHGQHISTNILDLRSSSQFENCINRKLVPETTVDSNHRSEYNQEMKRAAFLALAALASTQEHLRKKITESCAIMQHLIKELAGNDSKTLKSVLTCLLSLSRSVQQLRVSFTENNFYTALKVLLSSQSNDVLILVLGILCNISLDFSPGRQQFLDSETINTLCAHTRGSDPIVRLHAMWTLMNMVYQLKDQNIKFRIFTSLGSGQVVNILETENHEELVLKTLGFLRNLLSHKPHIDAIMICHGEQIMHSLTRVLERPCSVRIKEQALCVLTNIADGADGKVFIMNNKVILSYLARMLYEEQAGDIRLAAICCITNLGHRDQSGSCERRDELRKFGIENYLKSMLSTNDPILSDRVRTAYNQFCRTTEDKCID